MIVLCKDNKYHMHPRWETDKLIVFCEDDNVFVLFPREVTDERVRTVCREMGFYFKSFERFGVKPTIFSGQWKSMPAYKVAFKKCPPTPKESFTLSSLALAPDGMPVIECQT